MASFQYALMIFELIQFLKQTNYLMIIFLLFLQELRGNQNRTVINGECFVEKAYFYNLGSLVNDGGAILKTSSSDLRILNSIFSSCSAQLTGGAIKAIGGFFQTIYTCLNNCNVRTVKDNYFGNGFYIQSNTSIDLISFLKCGVSKESSADSSIYVLNGPAVIENSNFTCCHGTGGASSVFFDSMLSSSKMSYSNVAYGISNCGIVIVPGNPTTINNMNMLHMRCNWQLNFVYRPNSFFISCLYFNNTFSAFSGPSSATYSLCHSDNSGGLCTIATLYTHKNSPLSYEECTIHLIPTYNTRYSSIPMQVIILVLIII